MFMRSKFKQNYIVYLLHQTSKSHNEYAQIPCLRTFQNNNYDILEAVIHKMIDTTI